MANPRQRRNLNFYPSLGAATAVLAIAFLLTFVATPAAQAQTFKVIHNFTGGQDGGNPYAGLAIDKPGNLYGTAYKYGAHSYGTVYQLKQKNGNWTVNPLYSFGGSDGAYPRARLVFGKNGTLYGTTYGSVGGYGVVFNLRPSASACKTALCPWTETVLHTFSAGADGAYPGYGNLIFDQNGNIYDTTVQGGHSNAGTVYELAPSGGGWTESVLYSFGGGSDGYYWYGSVAFDNDGNLYGTTYQGGLHNDGTIFQLVPSMGGWTENILYSFQNGTDGALPVAGVILDQLGNLYGTTYYGGTGGAGTAFELTPEGNGNWTFTTLYSFIGSHDCGPFDNLVPDGAGNLYGITYCGGANNLGSVFKLTPTSQPPWTYTSLHDFTGGNDGKNPYGTVVFDANGNLYGTASAGGSAGIGVVWEITP